jgi:putative heme uptake system protein
MTDSSGVEAAPDPAPARVTYLLIDGENLDATLGNSILARRPSPEERPRWERVVEFAQQTWGDPVKALFFINASSGSLPMPFLQALTAMGLRPVLLSGPPEAKVVDVGIKRTLQAIVRRDANVMLGSHDADFRPEIEDVLTGNRKVAILGFREFVSSSYVELTKSGLEIFDIEQDAKSFNRVLPRMRVISLDEFDPEAFL